MTYKMKFVVSIVIIILSIISLFLFKFSNDICVYTGVLLGFGLGLLTNSENERKLNEKK